jgi:hypothetical protein
MSYQNVVNPGLVNVADQGDGLVVVDQPVKVSTSTNPGPLVQGLTSAPGLGVDVPDQPVTISPAMTAQSTVQGGTYSPSKPNVTTVITNNVAGQVYGTGSPSNVFV